MSITVDYATLEAANQQIRQISGGLEERLRDLRARLERMHWEGQDRVSYEQHRAEWENAMNGINRVLHEVGNAVGIARENYMATERSNANAWGGGR